MSEQQHEEAHTGPIKTPTQMMWVSLFSFIVPIFIIIGLVSFVVSDKKPAAGSTNMEKSVTERIAKVGTVEIRDANRPLARGEDVFKAQCSACHATGAAGSPKFGDHAAWAPRIKKKFEDLVNSALHGKGAMPPQGGGDFSDVEIARGAAFMANAGGAHFPEPQPAAAPAAK